MHFFELSIKTISTHILDPYPWLMLLKKWLHIFFQTYIFYYFFYETFAVKGLKGYKVIVLRARIEGDSKFKGQTRKH